MQTSPIVRRIYIPGANMRTTAHQEVDKLCGKMKVLVRGFMGDFINAIGETIEPLLSGFGRDEPRCVRAFIASIRLVCFNSGAREGQRRPSFWENRIFVVVSPVLLITTTQRRHTQMDNHQGDPGTSKPGMIPAASFARVSTDSQATDDKTSIPEQLLAIRKYAEAKGYEIVEEISESVSGRKQDTDGLERLRDLAESGKIGAVLVYKWNRMARTVARFESLMLEMKLAGVDIVSLDGQSNATATGRMFNRMMAVFSEYQRDDLIETMAQDRRGLARAGKIMPSRYPPYGYEYDRDRRTYAVDEGRMEVVRALFRMVGVEGKALWAVKRLFDVAGYETRTGGYWHVSTLRDMVLNDVYLAHTSEDLRGLGVTEDVLSSLDPDALHGVSWFNTQRVETLPNGKQTKTPRPREEWIAVPIADASIPREWVVAAREKIEDNVRPSSAGHREWTLKGLAYCACGSRLKPFTARRPHGLHFYMVCGNHRSGKDPCPHARYLPATTKRRGPDPEQGLEERVEDFVLGLIEDPSVLREHVEKQAEEEKRALGDSRGRVDAIGRHLAEIDAERDRYTRLYARGKLDDAEYDRYIAELDTRKTATEEELARLGDARDRIEYLDALPGLVEEYLRDLPELVRGAGLGEVREYETIPEDRNADNPLGVYTLTPERVRDRTPGELDELRREQQGERAERLRALYEVLGLSVVAHKDGTLEIAWGEHGRCKLAGSGL